MIYFDFDFLSFFSKWVETSKYQVILKPWPSLILYIVGDQKGHFEPYKKGH